MKKKEILKKPEKIFHLNLYWMKLNLLKLVNI